MNQNIPIYQDSFVYPEWQHEFETFKSDQEDPFNESILYEDFQQETKFFF